MIRIHLLPETPASGPIWSCAEIRLLRPYRHAALRDHFGVTSGRSLPLGRLDLVVTQRSGPIGLDFSGIVALLREIRARKARIVYDIDDDLLSPHPVPEVERELMPARSKMRFLLREADLVTVSSPILAARVGVLSRRVAVWRNALDETLVPPLSFDRKGAEIGYFGTYSHLPDLMAVIGSLQAAAAAGPALRLELCGISNDPRLALIGSAQLRSSIRPVEVHYGRFHRMLAQEAMWRVGLAPLRNSRFNAAKSDVKALDYAAAGIAAIVSDSPAYDGLESTGAVLRCPHDEFGAAAFGLLRDEETRRALVKRAREWLFSERVLAVAVPALDTLIQGVMDG